MTHSVIPQFLYDVVRFYPKCDKACNKSCLLSISLPAAGSRQGKPPQGKCYSSLLVFEVAASWAAEAAACGLWLVGLLKIWSLTFQVRMSHSHWSHNCSCEITQARWEERTLEQTCGLDSVSDNTTVCVCVRTCVCTCASVHVVFPHPPIRPLMQNCNPSLKHYCFLFSLLAFIQKHADFYEFIHLPDSCILAKTFLCSPFPSDNKLIRHSWQTGEIHFFVLTQTQWIMDINMDMQLCFCAREN